MGGGALTCKNFWTASLTALPHMIAFTIEAKLSSNSTIAEASLATSVPAIPMENPTSAVLSAGASFVPSPVTATVSPKSFNRLTRIRLSSGLERAKTCSFGMTAFISPLSNLRK